MTNAYTIRLSRAGQPSITLDTIAIHRTLGDVYGHHRNEGGYDVSSSDYRTEMTRTEIADAANTLRATFADVRIRRTTRRVKIAPSTEIAETFSDLEKAWQAMAADGMSHTAMRQVMINRDDFRAIADRAAS